ncbi:hypothetical protein BASA81_006330 [Batrachochytrium salamandrivorans]|nr:hypothetical protein BASA81_006330 [Batrachochytrium salamandrivorans]
MMSFAKGFLPPLILCLLILIKKLRDHRDKLVRTFPFLKLESFLPIHQSELQGRKLLGFLAGLHLRQPKNTAKLSGFFAPSPQIVQFSLASPLLARGVLDQTKTSATAVDEAGLKQAHDVAISQAMYQTRNWHRADSVQDVTAQVKNALLPIAMQVAKNRPNAVSTFVHSEFDCGNPFANEVWATSTSLVSWLLFQLGAHGEECALVVKEMDDKVGKRVPPSYKEVASFLPMLDHCFLESRRLNTPSKVIHIDVDRHLEIGDFVVPKGAVLHLPLFLAHHQEEFFHQPNTFAPQRFVERPLEKENLVLSSNSEADLVAQTVSRAFVAFIVQQFTISGAKTNLLASEEDHQLNLPNAKFDLQFTKREVGRTL